MSLGFCLELSWFELEFGALSVFLLSIESRFFGSKIYIFPVGIMWGSKGSLLCIFFPFLEVFISLSRN